MLNITSLGKLFFKNDPIKSVFSFKKKIFNKKPFTLHKMYAQIPTKCTMVDMLST